ncbi:MAG TPA: endo alpha-1,4 polygalactosaminidase [Castellaniella sp.]|nr:endo alpha-1,4 polygalactosaminidase [Castellaniella sp.]
MSERTAFAARIARDAPDIGFYYGPQDPAGLLGDFQIAIVEPGHHHKPAPATQSGPQWLAYLSMGEILPCAPCFNTMPSAWRIGKNTAWDAWIIDQTSPGWPDFLIEHLAQPIWRKGYQGFFLDTVDSYALLGQDSHAQARQRAGLIRSIERLRNAFPQAVIVLNRGFELLARIHEAVDAVAFESLYQGWNQAEGRYQRVSVQDRDWLLAQAQQAQTYGLPVIALDYCAPDAPALAISTLERISRHGIVPSIADGQLQTTYRNPKPQDSDMHRTE